MDTRYIASLASSRAVYQRGLSYYNEGRVAGFTLQNGPDGTSSITALVRGGKNYAVKIRLDEKGQVDDYACECPAYFEYDGCCKHVVAALLNLYVKQGPAPAAAPKRMLSDEPAPVSVSAPQAEMNTDRYARLMLNAYQDKKTGEALEALAGRKARLVPQIDSDYNGHLILNLSVGFDRLYIIKDLPKFYNDMNQHNTVEYGPKLSLLHHESMFEEESRPLLSFFLNKFREYQEYTGRSSSYSVGYNKRSLYISPNSFDELFCLNSGKTVQFRASGKDVLFLDENPPLKLQVGKAGTQTYLVDLKPSFVLLHGEKYEYVLIGEKLYRCTEEFSAGTGGLITAVSRKRGGIVLARKDMPGFCSDVLSEVKEQIEIHADEKELSAFKPSPLAARLYLDMPDQNLLTAALKFCYGELSFPSEEKPGRQQGFRDFKQETLLGSLVRQCFDSYEPDGKYFYTREEGRIFSFLYEKLPSLQEKLEVYLADSVKRSAVRRQPSVSVGVRLDGGLLDLDFDTGEFPPDELKAVLDSMRRKKKYHRLKDGSFLSLGDGALDDFSRLTESLGLSEKDLRSGRASVPGCRAFYLDGLIRDGGRIQFERSEEFRTMVRDFRNYDDTDFAIPANLGTVLRNYQKTGFRWLKTLYRYGFGGVLADDMGLGKTLQTIALFQSVKEEHPLGALSLVVCPTSLVLNWESEIRRFAPSLKPVAVIGPSGQRTELIKSLSGFDVAVTSYELLKRDIESYEDLTFDCQVIDEAQYIKNHNTQNAKAVKRIKSARRFALTGTPVENSLAELWSIFDFLMPGYLYSYHKFKNTFEIPIVKEEDPEALKQLRKMVSPFLLRRMKSSVLRELPPKTETVLGIRLEGEQKRLYLANAAKLKNELSGDREPDARNKMEILSMLTRLRQICCDPALAYDNYRGGSAKLEACLELIDSSRGAGHRVLVFSQFTSLLAIIGEKLKEREITFFLLEGSTPKEERSRLVGSFNNGGAQVFLISLKAGGTGLNLTGADIVIHYDPWWNMSAQNQATDRAYRIGQKNNVQVYKLIARNTIEEKILSLQKDKSRLADSIVTEGGGLLSCISRQELLELFS